MPVVRPGVIREKIVVKGNINRIFDFMTDFSNAHLWDPGVISSNPDNNFEKLMITVGTGYDLVVHFNGTKIDMKYYITKFNQPNEVILEGESKIVKVKDIIKFTRLENNQTQIDYEVDLTFKGWRRPFILFINNSLNKLGKSAKSGIENYFKFGNKEGN